MKIAILAAALLAAAATPALADDKGAPRGPDAAIAVAANLPGYKASEIDPAARMARIAYLEFPGVGAGTKDARLIAERICDESRDAGWVGSWVVATTDGGRPTAACLVGDKHADLEAKLDAIRSLARRAGASQIATTHGDRTIHLKAREWQRGEAAASLAPICALAIDIGLGLGEPWTITAYTDGAPGEDKLAACLAK